MYCVMYEWKFGSDCWGEYDSLEEAEAVCDGLLDRGMEAWICSDEE